MRNESRLVNAIENTTVLVRTVEALAYVNRHIKFKIRASRFRLSKLRKETDKFYRFKQADAFYSEVEFDHFITSLRSALDYLAQLVNIVYTLGLVQIRMPHSGKATADFANVTEALKNTYPRDKLTDLFKNTVNGSWFKELNTRRIVIIHVSPSPAATATTVVMKAPVGLGRSRTQITGNESPLSQSAPNMTRQLILSDDGTGTSYTKQTEVMIYCTPAIKEVVKVIEKTYGLLVKKL